MQSTVSTVKTAVRNLFKSKGENRLATAILQEQINQRDEQRRKNGFLVDPIIRLEFDGITLPANIETQNILITGGTGVGKSNTVRDLCRQVRRVDQKMIRVVSEDELATIDIRPTDIVFNPLDDRFPAWDMWNELRMEYDYQAFSTALVKVDSENMWVGEITQKVLAGIIQKTTSIESLLAATESDLGDIEQMLIGTQGEGMIGSSPISANSTNPVMAVLKRAVKVFSNIKTLEAGVEKFSLRNWVDDDSDRRCVYLAYRPDRKEELEPLFSLALDIVAREVMAQAPNKEMPEDQQRRVWIIQDDWVFEYPFMFEALAVGRKYGMCVVISIQAYSQLVELFGENFAKQLVGCCNTWLIHQANSREEAQAISTLVGPMESVIDGHKVEQVAVMPEKIQMLKPCSCILFVRNCSPAVVNIPFATQ